MFFEDLARGHRAYSACHRHPGPIVPTAQSPARPIEERLMSFDDALASYTKLY